MDGNETELERTPDQGGSATLWHSCASQVTSGLLWEGTGINGLSPIGWFWWQDLCSVREIPFCISREIYLVSLPQSSFAKTKDELCFRSNLRALKFLFQERSPVREGRETDPRMAPGAFGHPREPPSTHIVWGGVLGCCQDLGLARWTARSGACTQTTLYTFR